MSRNCIFVVRNTHKIDELKKALIVCAKTNHRGVFFTPAFSVLNSMYLKRKPSDFVFIPTDNMECNDASLLLSYEGMTTNGVMETQPLIERLQVVQMMAQICMDYGNVLDMYLSDDNPYLPEYSSYDISDREVASVLLKEYEKEGDDSFFLPCVHLHIKKANG